MNTLGFIKCTNSKITQPFTKKSVNSAHFSVFQRPERVRIITNRSQTPNQELLGSVNERTGRLLKKREFPYKRIPTKTENKTMRTWIRAPGSFIEESLDLPDDDSASDSITTSIRTGFTPVYKPTRSFLAIPPRKVAPLYRNLTKSQENTKNYLKSLKPHSERSFINKQIKEKLKKLQEKLEKQIGKAVENYDKRGILPHKLNELRSKSRMKLLLKVNVLKQLDGSKQQAKTEFLSKPRLRHRKQSGDPLERRKQLLRTVESSIARKIVRKHRTETPKVPQKLGLQEFAEEITHTISDLMDKCLPSSRVQISP